MQWLIDILAAKVIAEIGIPPVYVERYPSPVGDFDQNDFTLDGNYHTLDLSAIVPAGVSAINLSVKVRTDIAASYVRFRHPDDGRVTGRCILRTQVAGMDFRMVWCQGCDVNRHVEYSFNNVVWDSVAFVVRGWWL
ncbi:hypothetical protein ES703_78502 [subsurface metagenome]